MYQILRLVRIKGHLHIIFSVNLGIIEFRSYNLVSDILFSYKCSIVVKKNSLKLFKTLAGLNILLKQLSFYLLLLFFYFFTLK